MTDPITRLNVALEGRYRVDRESQGGMATVYLAHDERHNRKVALKVLNPELAAMVGAERFLAEIQTTANLQHPHILPLFDSGEAAGGAEGGRVLYFVMPYVEGESLRDRLDREQQLPVEEATRIVRQVAGALDYAYRQGVVHRDIKPANILIQEGQPVVADFRSGSVRSATIHDIGPSWRARESSCEWMTKSDPIRRRGGRGRSGSCARSSASEHHGSHWLAYSSNETGREEVFVRPFPDVESGRAQVSTNGGSNPLWAHNGNELFYFEGGRRLLAARFTTEPGFRVVEREPLFDLGAEYVLGDGGADFYDIAPDDQRFLIGRLVGATADAELPKYVVVENFFEELRGVDPE